MERFKKQFAELFGLPAEIVLDLPLFMIVGRDKLFLENHKGVTLYQSDLIKIRIKAGYFIIKGKDLFIDEIMSENLRISGKILSLSFEER
jgi:sporulation protein YqfC